MSLLALVEKEISLGGGWLRFDRLMKLALYQPEYGYYSQGVQLGRDGDFFTSVSVGPMFGAMLAGWVRDEIKVLEEESADEVCLIEQGGHNGQLMADILLALPGDLRSRLKVILVEPCPALEDQQRKKLADAGASIRWVNALEDLTSCRGVFFANELLDAFPVRRFRWESKSGWREWGVTWGGGALKLELGPVHEIPDGFPFDWIAPGGCSGFEYEWAPSQGPWLRDLSNVLSHGAALWIDYGHAREEWVQAPRVSGTFRAYRSHQRLDAPEQWLPLLGDVDLTYSIDFSRLAEELATLGWSIGEFTDQHRFLLRHGEACLLALEKMSDLERSAERASAVRQVQQLTHPEMMGNSFRVMTARRENGLPN